MKMPVVLLLLLFCWDSLHARLSSQCKVWSYKKKKPKMIKKYRNSAVKRCLLILELKPFRS